MRHLFVTAMAAALLFSSVHAAPLKSNGKPNSVPIDNLDLGPTTPDQVITASLVLKVHNPAALEALLIAQQDPNNFLYHRFLSLQEFVAFFSPTRFEIANIERFLNQFDIQVTEVYENRLLIRATGTVASFDKAFSTDVHDFWRNGKRFHRPRSLPIIPLALHDLVIVVEGLSDEGAMFHPMNANTAKFGVPAKTQDAVTLPKPGVIATGVPGDFTVGDVANMYNINPLYAANINGSGRTVGIATLANFHPEDAYTYWSLIGLDVLPNRITQVHVDGGGELSADAGSGETSLDVEQSGGLAPQAKMIVYDAPNTFSGFIDLFYRVASDNKVDTISVSWGSAEEFYFPTVVGVDRTGEMIALHQAFVESAVQGISMFASSGDNGAFDINNAFNDPVNNVLTVDSPANDPAITAAGGTTTPFTARFRGVPAGTPDLVVSTEQVWGWDYLQDYLVKFLSPQFQDALFPVGGGGGVSIFWPTPSYQLGTKGIRTTEPGQSVIFDDGTGSGPQDLLDLPAKFRGRNIPDVSLDADPFSGFIVLSTEDGGLIDGFGGTSFVAPQLNGIAALLGQRVQGRLGLLNPALYRFQKTYGYGANSPLVDIKAGDNWFYNGIAGYEPGAGLGVLNVANLADAFVRENKAAQH